MLKFNNQTWFLDHTGINHKVKYLGKWEKNDYLLYQTILDHKMSEYCYSNGYNKHMDNANHPILLLIFYSHSYLLYPLINFINY